MKTFVLLLGLVFVSGFAYANCGNGPNDGGNGCSGNTGPQGPAGTNGINGIDGANGRDGNSAGNSSVLVLDTAIRLIDTRYFQLQAFNVYNLARGENQHTTADGGNFMYGARVVFKLGQSYEEREIQKLRADLKRLEAR